MARRKNKQPLPARLGWEGAATGYRVRASGLSRPPVWQAEALLLSALEDQLHGVCQTKSPVGHLDGLTGLMRWMAGCLPQAQLAVPAGQGRLLALGALEYQQLRHGWL